MTEPRRAVLAGTGSYLPAQVVTNAQMAERVETSDEWIVERTGIRQRHFAAPHETAAYMGAQAARRALEQAGLAPEEVGAIIVATSTPDHGPFPATAVHIQAALGAKNAFGFDLAAACSGFIYGLSVADAMIRVGQVSNVLVIGSEVYSRIIDFSDRTTCVLFGDGAGAVLLRADADGSGAGLLSTHLHSDGTLADLLFVDGAVGQPDKSGFLVMNGREVFRHAVTLLASAVTEALTKNNLAPEDIDWLVPHQANRRIIDGVGRKLGLPAERVIVTVDRHANTSAASIPLALDLAAAMTDGRIRPGQLVLLEALGGGLTWGSALLRL